VVIATAEPYQRAWEAEMLPILRKDIRRVISNPDDITRFQVEFYNLAKSIKGAMKKGDVAGGASNFEQLVELGKGNKQFDANDQHIVTIVDWLWQYAFEQRASRHPHRAAARPRHRALPHRRRAASGVPDSDDGAEGDDQPHQDPRPHGRDREAAAAGRPHQDAHAGRAGGRTAPVHAADGLRRKAGDADFRSGGAGPRFSELGFATRTQTQWNEMTSRPNGIVLVTGPTG
jgi:general secretion pathway protein E